MVRIFVMGSAMNRWSLIAAALMIAFELLSLRAANRALRSGEDIPKVIWNSSIALESLFPALGISFLASSRLLPDYRPLATPWVLAFFPFILLSVLRLSPRLCWVAGIFSTTGYLVAAFMTGWKFSGSDGFTVTETAVAYFAAVILATGILAAGVAAQIRTHVEAALREAETKHQLKQIEHELNIARSIQQALLPKVRPKIRGFEVAGWSQSADDTGGDFYDWKKLPDGRWAVILADVTGHGIGPAILASVCRAYSRAIFNVRDSLENMLKNINISFAEDLTPERFATFVAAACQEGSGQVELLSAGHAPILIYSSEDKSLSILDAQALPLGILPELWEAMPVKVTMKPGDIVVLITDGFLEWENNSGEQFGTDRLAAIIRQFSDCEPELIIVELYDSVLEFAHGTPQQDDLTAVLIKRSADNL
ncbi:MAG TPA: PP2C family protein-serine/threonine phosphatase [Candidatus Sulfotelmatobacter sp.]|nr:PP2C family protein-serine/threonine phosphatase [Candidatus Sulfotelmatobacter sp.]